MAAALAMVGTAVAAPEALAHAFLERSEPPDGTVLAAAPREVRLWFSEDIVPEFSTAHVLDIDGRPVELSGVRADPSEPGLLISLPELEPGLYSVSWKVLSGEDGHFRRGLVVFGVGDGVTLPAAAAAQPETPLPPLEVVLRWLNFGLLAALAGAVAVAHLVLARVEGRGGAAAAAARRARRRVLGWAGWCGGLSLAVGIGLLLWQAATLARELPDGSSLQDVGWELVSGTRWGALWLARQGILLALVGVVLLLRPAIELDPRLGSLRRLALPVAGTLIPALMIVQALTGHAAAVSPKTTLAVLAAALHLLAASLWVGGLLALVVGLWPLIGRGKAESAALARACLRPFSRLAALSVGMLMATGLYYTGRQVASLDALITTLYGQALLAKGGLVLAAGAFGLLNSILLHPALASPLARLLGRPPGWTPLSFTRLRTLVLTEAGVGLLVLLAAGLLTAAVPARGPEFAAASKESPTSLSRSVNDLVVTLSAKPNRPGQNVFHVLAASTRRPPPAEITRVTLRFSSSGRAPAGLSAAMEEVEPGRYRLGGGFLTAAGRWEIAVVVQRGGLEHSVARFDWNVAAPAPARTVVVSNRPLEPLLTVAAAVTGLIVVLVTAWRLGRRRIPRSRPAGSARVGLPMEEQAS